MKCTKKLLLTFSKDGSHVDFLTPLTQLQLLHLATFSRIPLFQRNCSICIFSFEKFLGEPVFNVAWVGHAFLLPR
jgi:hypothetical protein